MITIAKRLQSALDSVQANAHQAKRDPNNITLLAVSKTKPISDIKEAFQAGQRCFGENYVQEGVEKIQALTHLADIEWHFIGPLQSNKTRKVAEHFDWVQSVDRLKTAQRLSAQRPNTMPPLQVCIQVNISGEEAKSGVTPEAAPALAVAISNLPNLTLRGLMAIPAATKNETEQRAAFEKMHRLFAHLKHDFDSIDTLSIGMSGDMSAAIHSGSTMVRIGTAIFGARDKPAP